jgi:hypothetical protein
VGDVLRRRRAWQAALTAGLVEAYLEPSRVVIVNHSDEAVQVPLTAATAPDEPPVPSSGWIKAMPGVTSIARAETHEPRRAHVHVR